MTARNRTMGIEISRRRSCAMVFAQGAMPGLADFDADAGGEFGGQPQLRAENAEDERIPTPDQLDPPAHTHPKHLESLHFLVVSLYAPHDGAYARRQRIQTNQFFGSMVNCCHSLCKISFPVAMSITPLVLVDMLIPAAAL